MQIPACTFYTDTEVNDDQHCSVLSFAHALELPYHIAFNEFKSLVHRERNRACSTGDCIKVYESTSCGLNGYKVKLKGYYGFFQELNTGRHAKSEEFKACTLFEFIQRNPTGRFIVHVKGHVTAIINGVLYDGYAQDADQEVLAVFEVFSAN